MGERSKLYYCDPFPLPLPSGHRFPLSKYQLLRERVCSSEVAGRVELRIPEAASEEQLRSVHTDAYLAKLKAGSLTQLEQRRIGFPWSPQLLERCRRSAGGTLAAARAALEEGLGIHLAGGTHHAFPDHGQGFCVFNDVAVAIRVLQNQGLIQRALAIDCDVHQGNGTAAIFAGDANVFTFSMHGAMNFPFAKCDSKLDISLPDGTGDDEYLAQLARAIDHSLPFDEVDCVFYLAGADPFAGDRYGRLALTKEGLARRDELVLAACRRREIPLVIVMAGGYAREIRDVVDIHHQTIMLATSQRGRTE